jgi:hypothetical protein
MSLRVSVASDHHQVFINNELSLRFITKLHGAVNPLRELLSSKSFLCDYNV